MELLSPAGNREALIAAVQNGADAVYLGYTAFGARSYAGNFDEAGLAEAVRYCHERGRRVYVTVNTLVKEPEMDDAADVLEMLCRRGADAVLVQDLGLAALCRERFPDLALHASTQMTIHNAQGVRLLREMGFTRVVPARECPLEEIRLIAAEGLETEVFVHGALCVSVSGQCLFSGIVGGRSGNRGKCAQPCRMRYRRPDGVQGCLLSTRDLMLLQRLPELRDAGVDSLKIEGRMKRPEYVAVVTAAYRRALDCAQRGEPYAPDEATCQALRQIFNRGGFTEGYLMDKNNAALMSWERPGHFGVPVGRVERVRGELAGVRLERALHDGDGLALRGAGERETVYSGPERAAGEEALVRMAQGEGPAPRAGDGVFRLTDAHQMDAARESYARERVRIPFDAHLTARVGERPALSVADGVYKALALGETPVQPARSRALDADAARRQIEKTGDTPYALRSLTLDCEDGFLPVSALNALRRDALQALSDARCALPERRVLTAASVMRRPAGERWLIAQTPRLQSAQALLNAGADWVYWSPDDLRPERVASQLDALEAGTRARVWVVLPQLAFTRELDALCGVLRSQALAGAVLGNPSQLTLPLDMPMAGDTGMNVYNARTADFLFNRGCVRVTLSPELRLTEIREAVRAGGGFELTVYGRTQLMLLSHCTDCTRRGLTGRDDACERCAHGGGAQSQPLIDRKGFVFPLRRQRLAHGCMLRLYNSLPTDMTQAMDRLRALPVSMRLQFTDEDDALCADVTCHYRRLMDGQASDFAHPRETTSGLLRRGVE